MLIYSSISTKAELNLAIEEYLFNTLDFAPPIIYFWQNESAIIVGRNQNTLAEINFNAVNQDQVPVVRRLTGGGTVFHDLGNLCFSLILAKDGSRSSGEAFHQCLNPVLEYLHHLGIPAQFKGRNDLEVNGAKVSGTAQLQTKKRILIHGTLLFDVNLEQMSRYLTVNPLKLESKKIKSVPSRVANLKNFLAAEMTMFDFKHGLETFYQHEQDVQPLILTPTSWKEIGKLMQSKYQTWAWNFGTNETFTTHQAKYFPAVGLIEAHFNTEDGVIKNLKFYGDFLGSTNSEELASQLIGLPYNPPVIQNFFAQHSALLQTIFGPATTSEMLNELLFS